MDGCKIKYIAYNAGNIRNARKMRMYPTPAELKLWEEVLKHRPLGYKFIRQKPLDFFIVDFYCARLRLAIELDGQGHKQQIEYDLARDITLHKKGVSVARYRNYEVMGNPDKVYKEIMDLIKTRSKEIQKSSI